MIRATAMIRATKDASDLTQINLTEPPHVPN